MAKNSTIRKGLVCVVMVLFIGMGIMPIAGSLSMEKQTLKSNLGDDTTPPVTTIYFDPPYPDGDNGWYVSDVTITLEATDDMSGVDIIKYLLDDSDWLTYTSPFTVESDGCHRITYYAIDKAGNVEQPSEVIRFKIDQTPPTIELTWQVSGDDLIFTATCSDATSGVDRVEFYINDVLAFTDDMEPYVWILYYQGGPYTYKAIVFDIAGNSAFVIVKDSDVESYSNSQSRQQSSTGSTVVTKATTPTSYDGNTLYVGGDGLGNYSSIQDAIDDAEWDDTVFVYDDSSPYHEHIIIDKRIQLIGEEKNTTIIDGGGFDDVILIGGYADGVTITGFTIQNSGNDFYDAAIEIRTMGTLITNNKIVDIPGMGIYCNNMDYWSEWNILSGNIITNNKCGVFLDISLNNKIYDNHVSDNGFGIWIGRSQLPSAKRNLFLDEFFNNVYRNTITNNTYGVLLSPSWYAYIYENNITNNKYGIKIDTPYLCSCNYNYIYQNNIMNNGDGVIIWESAYSPAKDNYVYQNNFIGNIDNAYDIGWNNKWDNGSVGNYWDDYTGKDILPPYGIGDTPYDIPPRLLFNKDRHPLMGPWPDSYNNQCSQNIQNNQQNSNS